MKNNRGHVVVALFFVFVVFFGAIVFVLGLKAAQSPKNIKEKPQISQTSTTTASQIPSVSVPLQWPPKLNQTYPKLRLMDQTGQFVELASFRGKVLLIEPIGMTCPACQSFSGAQKRGGYQGLSHQKDLQSIEEYLLLYGNGALLSDVVFIQILLYNLEMKAPTAEEAQDWAKHFQMERTKNQIVLAGIPELLGKDSYKMIPGFQLVDKNFVLRSDSTGHQPKENLYTKLLPMIPELLKEEARVETEASKTFIASPERIAKAYKMVPGGRHPQTPFQREKSTMSTAEKDYLERLFQWTDQALVRRVETLYTFQNFPKPQKSFVQYQTEMMMILEEIQQFSAPTQKLQEVHRLIVEAIQEQYDFFVLWNQALEENKKFPYRVFQGDPLHPLVNQSHQKLYRAYQLLMSIFPKESTNNKQAFFSYLCHLDFI